MHYKCYIFTNSVPDPYRIEDILKPFKRKYDIYGHPEEYDSNIPFIWDGYAVGGNYAIWNGAVMRLNNLKKFDPTDCFIAIDERSNAITRDMYTPNLDCSNPEFDYHAWMMADECSDGFVTIVDIRNS